jgi:hypothetical protein
MHLVYSITLERFIPWKSLSGVPLGQSAPPPESAQARDDARVRNQIEGKFGQGKRRFSLGRIMAKLDTTAETTIAITFLVMNLERLLQQLLFVLFRRYCYWWSFIITNQDGHLLLQHDRSLVAESVQ